MRGLRLANKTIYLCMNRGLYTPATQPKVFINEHTKVIC